MRFRGLFFALMLTLAGSSAVAQGYSSDHAMGAHAQQLPAYLQQAGLEQRLNQSLPMTATYTDETGHTGPLSDWFHGRPVVMALIYYKCAMLCPQVLHGLSAGLHDTTLQPGEDYDVLTFSIDPTDTPADAVKQKQMFLADVGRNAPADSVHFLVGSPASIAAVSGATG
ncbi:MAG: SCO family protein, partial [Terriglobus sp.]